MLSRLARALSLALPLVLATGGVAEAKKPRDPAGKTAPAGKKKGHGKTPKHGKAPTKGALAAATLAAAPRARPAPAAVPAEAPAAPAIAVQRAVLDNGLRVVLSVDRSAPTVGVAVTYDAGSREDDRGRAGLAHALEHMMFDGSANVARGDHVRLVGARGGVLDATTTVDRTSFFEEVPSGDLALALWLEADRMKSLEIDEARFEAARRTIEAERRSRIDAVPYARGQTRLRELVYQGAWAWEHDPIGSATELGGTSVEAVRAFWQTRYAPNRAVLAIAGDVDADEALELVRRFFDTAKKNEKAEPVAPAAPPEQTGPRGAVVEDAAARTPGAFWGWLGPETRGEAHDAVALALAILADGEGSRLHQRLVRERPLAREVTAWTDEQRGPDLLGLHAVLAEGAKLADVEKIVDAEIDALATRGPTAAELARARERARTAGLAALATNAARAVRLGEWELVWGDARRLAAEPARGWQLGAEQVRDAAARWLVPARRSRVEVRPPGAAAASAPAARPASAGARAPAGAVPAAAKTKSKPGAKPARPVKAGGKKPKKP